MSVRDIKAGGAYVELLLKDASFRKGLEAASKKFDTWGKGIALFGAKITGMGTAITAPLLAIANSFASTGNELYNLLQRLHIASRDLQMLQYAAQQTGVSFGAIEAAIAKARQSGRRFEDLAADIAAVEDPAAQLALAIRLFGTTTGPAIVPLLRDLPALREQFDKLGIALDENAIARAKVLTNLWADLRAVVKSASDAIGDALAPSIAEAVEIITSIAVRVRDWIRENRELFATALKVGVLIVGVGASLTSLGVGLTIVSTAVGGFAALLSAATAALSTIVSPLGLTVGALMGLATWFARSTEWGRHMVNSLAMWFGELRDIAIEAFGGIADALVAGDLVLAAKVAMAGISLAWLTGTDQLRASWSDFKDFYIRTTTDLVFDAERLWTNLIVKLTVGWKEFSRWWQDAWDVIVTSIAMIGETKDVQRELVKASVERVGAREQQGKNDLAAIEADRRKALEEIEAARSAADEDRSRQYERDRQARESTLAAAKEELSLLRERAAIARKEHDLSKGPVFEASKFDLSASYARDRLFATFSAAALVAQGGGTGDPGADRVVMAIEKAEREQAKRDERIERRLAERRGLNP